MQLLPALAMLTAITVRSTEGKKDHTTEQAKITDICKEHEYLQQLAEHLAGKSTNARTALSELQNLETTWRGAAASRTNHKQRCLLLGLAEEARTRATAANAAIANTERIANQAALLIAKHQGKLTAIHTTLKMAIEDDTTATTAAGTDTAQTLTLKIAASLTDTCRFRKKGDSDPLAANKPKFDQIKTLKLTDPARLTAALKPTTIAVTSITSSCSNR
uniref:Variant surface glycoprotein n=1 Tax=Trypanosoma brucei TaxID=5691 RepID=A0A1V0FZ13_9TRYP|nr:variant surface glycoprotein [Trypanosoma brucei]